MINESHSALSGIRSYRPVPWAHIPDLGLYMDQVITFISRACGPLYGGDSRGCLSPSMINNYVKARLIPRPVGKKYSREQIALLTMIAVLKQVCRMEDIRRMLALKEGETVETLYRSFSERFSRAVQSMCGEAAADAPASALDFAILASACSAGCAAALADEEAPVQ